MTEDERTLDELIAEVERLRPLAELGLALSGDQHFSRPGGYAPNGTVDSCGVCNGIGRLPETSEDEGGPPLCPHCRGTGWYGNDHARQS